MNCAMKRELELMMGAALDDGKADMDDLMRLVREVGVKHAQPVDTSDEEWGSG